MRCEGLASAVGLGLDHSARDRASAGLPPSPLYRSCGSSATGERLAPATGGRDLPPLLLPRSTRSAPALCPQWLAHRRPADEARHEREHPLQSPQHLLQLPPCFPRRLRRGRSCSGYGSGAVLRRGTPAPRGGAKPRTHPQALPPRSPVASADAPPLLPCREVSAHPHATTAGRDPLLHPLRRTHRGHYPSGK